MEDYSCRVCGELSTAFGHHVIVKHMGLTDRWHVQVCMHCWQIIEVMLDSARFPRKDRRAAEKAKLRMELVR